ncbi:MAG: hypothetical protein RR561_05300 [Peptostreptococcus sp.]|uniref:type II toxin-antitoxin system HicB family antitoxin n=1 Tax=Peptostreptococcus sp. TaxID=1262 RepID=UPI002FC7BB5B
MLDIPYAIAVKEVEGKFYVHVPDFDIATQVDDMDQAIKMGRHMTQIMMAHYREEGKNLPEPYSIDIKVGDYDAVFSI